MANYIAVTGCQVVIYVSAVGDVQGLPIVQPPTMQRVKASGIPAYFDEIKVVVTGAVYNGMTLDGTANLSIKGTASRVKSNGKKAVLQGDKSQPVMCTWRYGEYSTQAPLTAEVKMAGQTRAKAS